MNFSPIGDLAQNLLMRRRGSDLRSDLSKLTQELATGQSNDLAKKIRGEFSTISSLENSLKRHEGYAIARQNIDQALIFSQEALGGMQALLDETALPLLSAASSETISNAEPFIARGTDLFVDLVAKANTKTSGKFLFSGTMSQTKPVMPAADILSDLEVAVAGLTTAQDVSDAVDTWFDDPLSGFHATGYSGADPATGKVAISDGQSVALKTTAKDDEFRAAFKSAAKLALVDRGNLNLGEPEALELLQTSANGMLSASGQLISVQANLGFMQERLENTSTQASVEKQILEMTKNDIISADPYETAVRLEAAQTQLESLYLVTARTSRLNLSEYLR